MPTASRRCSLCRLTGHTKRNCPNTSKSILAMLQKKSATDVSQAIRYAQEVNQSHHVIDLRQKDPAETWAAVELYEEAPAPVSVAQALPVQVKSTVVQEQTHAVLQQQTEAVQSTTRQVIKEKQSIAFSVWKERFRASFGRIKGFGQDLLNGFRMMPKHVASSIEAVLLPIGNFFAPFFKPRRSFAYMASFLIFALTIPLPATAYYRSVQQNNDEIVSASTYGFNALQSSTLALLQADMGSAQNDLVQALAAFNEASTLLQEEHIMLQRIGNVLPFLDRYVQSRSGVVDAGQYISLGNSYLLKGVNESVDKTRYTHPTDQLARLAQHVNGALRQYEKAQYALAAIDTDVLPDEYQTRFTAFHLLFTAFVGDMKDVARLIDSLQLVLGSEDFRRYIISFQNHRELRPTGGFMGSYAVVDVQKGRILDIHVPGGGWYDLRGQLDTYVEPPLPLQLVNDRWEAQDANWWPDFPASAETIAWFYEHSRGTTIDGVVAVNASVLEQVLQVLGGIALDETGEVFDAATVLDELQEEVEVTPDKIFDNPNPKAIVATLFDQLVNDLSSLEIIDLLRLLTVANEAATANELQVYMADEALQTHFDDFGWTGQVHESTAEQDYLFVVNSNVQSQKSDARMTQHIEHQAVIDEDGRVVVTVIMTRKHNGEAGERFYGAPNISYVRAYVPKGAELVSAGGFAFPPEQLFRAPEPWYEPSTVIAEHEFNAFIDQETGTSVHESFGKTVFGNWMITNPGQETVAYFSYVLPFRVSVAQQTASADVAARLRESTAASRYQLYVQKQSGITSEFESRIIYPDGWKPVWRSDDVISFALNGAEITATLDHDQFWGIVMEAES